MVICLFATPAAFAKRSPPVKVDPVRQGAVEYRVPHDQMGCVEAWDVSTDRLIWRKQVYVVRYDVVLEKDVQDVFITLVTPTKGTLVIKNENHSEYVLDLDTLQVTVTKGKLVEHVKR